MAGNNKIDISINMSIYPLEAIVSASYAFLDKAYIHLDQPKAGLVKAVIKSKKGSAVKLKDKFMNELLFATERIGAVKRNKKIREFIVGKALFSAVEPGNTALPAAADGDKDDEEDEEWLDDPLGIAVPWDEKK